MGKTGEKQKRRPKFKDKKQSERFKETAREIRADESSDAFDRVIDVTNEVNKHIKSSADMIRKSSDEIGDARRHVSKSADAIKRSTRLLKKAKD